MQYLGRRCCIAAAAYPFWRYALSLLIHHSTLVILLWDGAAYNPAVDRTDLCAPCPGSDPSALFSSAGLRRDRFFRDDRSNICALAQFWPSCDILYHHYCDLPYSRRFPIAIAPGLVRAPTLCSFSCLAWRASQLLRCFSFCPARPCPCSNPPAYPATTPVLIAIDCEAHNQSSAG